MSTQNLIKDFPDYPPLNAGVHPREEVLTHFHFAAVTTGLSSLCSTGTPFPQKEGNATLCAAALRGFFDQFKIAHKDKTEIVAVVST